jgi:lysyl-tRNA synthetase class 2
MSHRTVRCMRPYLFHSFKRSHCAVSTRAFSRSTIALQDKASKDVTHDYEKRLAQLDAYKPREDWYPRLASIAQAERIPIAKFEQQYEQLDGDETRDEIRTITGTMLLPT